MTLARWKLAAAVYAFVAIVTFGHAAAREEAQTIEHAAQCRAEERSYCANLDPEMHGFAAGVFDAALWPLYWSWMVWA